jgi:hypothetical protein
MEPEAGIVVTKNRTRGRPRSSLGSININLRGVDETTEVAFQLLSGVSRSQAEAFATIVRWAFEYRALTNENARALLKIVFKDKNKRGDA